VSDRDRIPADDDPRRDIDEEAERAEAEAAALDPEVVEPAEPVAVPVHHDVSDPTPDEAIGGAHAGPVHDGETVPDGLRGSVAGTAAATATTATRPGPRGLGHVAEHDTDDWWRTWLGRTIAILGSVLVLATALIWAWMGGLSNPTPKDVPVGIITGDATAQALMTAVGTQSSALEAVRYATPRDALNALSKRKVAAILASDAIGLDGGLNLTVASGAGPGLAATVTTAISNAAGAFNLPLTVEDVYPTSENDPTGASPFYIALGWILGGLLAALALGIAVGTVPRDLDRLGMRLGALAVFSLLLGLLGALFAGPVLGVWGKHTFGLWMCGFLITLTAALITTALQSWLGMWGIGLAALLLIVLGVPGAGGTVASALLPGFFRGMHYWIPTGLGTDLVRGLEYFGRNANAWPIIGLTLWSLASIIALVAATAVLGRKARQADRPAPETSMTPSAARPTPA
jgi:hypothetical protein